MFFENLLRSILRRKIIWSGEISRQTPFCDTGRSMQYKNFPHADSRSRLSIVRGGLVLSSSMDPFDRICIV